MSESERAHVLSCWLRGRQHLLVALRTPHDKHMLVLLRRHQLLLHLGESEQVSRLHLGRRRQGFLSLRHQLLEAGIFHGNIAFGGVLR